MPNVGMSELIVVLMILLLVFGASRLPALGESLGKTVRSLKRGMSNDDGIAVTKAEPKKPADDTTGKRPERADVEDAEVVERKS